MWSTTTSFVISVIIVKCLSCVFAYGCYPDFCHTPAENFSGEGLRCLLTPVQNDTDCINLKLFNPGHLPPKAVSAADIKLSAYVAVFPGLHQSITAFNLTVNNVDFYKLTTKYLDLGNPHRSYCRHVQLFRHPKTHELPDMFVSCPFSNSSFEGESYRLEYLVVGENYVFSRKLTFRVPNHLSIGENIKDVDDYVPFFYVDVSEANSLQLYIQPIPERFNVSLYKVWLIDNDTDTTMTITLSLADTKPDSHLYYAFAVEEGVNYYFRVSAVHPNCGEYGCINSTSPEIFTKYPTRRLLIMIVSIVWIPPVILYAIYYMYKLCRKRELLKRLNKKPNCLLVYSPTHLAHVNVIVNLAKYLRACNINAMIDQSDIPESDTKDPGLWCNKAFKNADIIIVTSSPPVTDIKVPVIYQNMDHHALRLIKENYSRRNKRYVAIEFPYCKPEDLPEEAEVFKRFHLPENLEKLVCYIYNIEHVRFCEVSSKELISNIDLATMTIQQERPCSPTKSVKETDDLLPVSLMSPPVVDDEEEIKLFISKKVSSDNLNFTNSAIIRNYTTKLDDLNLLGESLETNAVNDDFESRKIGEFCIDQLDL